MSRAPAPVDQRCGNCAFRRGPIGEHGRPLYQAGGCVAPLPDLPPLPDCVADFPWPPLRIAVWPYDGKTCPAWTFTAKPVA